MGSYTPRTSTTIETEIIERYIEAVSEGVNTEIINCGRIVFHDLERHLNRNSYYKSAKINQSLLKTVRHMQPSVMTSRAELNDGQYFFEI